ncbi:MAG: helix-hairpin-helix domain-containing protein [Acidimicrobiia bacterium]
MKSDLTKIPYVGPAIEKDFLLLGINEIDDLRGKSHTELFNQLCKTTSSNQDPCVLDTFQMAIHFAETGESLPWWHFSRIRKASGS